jgi:cytochrome b
VRPLVLGRLLKGVREDTIALLLRLTLRAPALLRQLWRCIKFACCIFLNAAWGVVGTDLRRFAPAQKMRAIVVRRLRSAVREGRQRLRRPEHV